MNETEKAFWTYARTRSKVRSMLRIGKGWRELGAAADATSIDLRRLGETMIVFRKGVHSWRETA